MARPSWDRVLQSKPINDGSMASKVRGTKIKENKTSVMFTEHLNHLFAYGMVQASWRLDLNT